MTDTRELCFILTDAKLGYWWSGRGFRRLGAVLPVLAMPHWQTRKEADEEAKRLQRDLNLTNCAVTRVRALAQ